MTRNLFLGLFVGVLTLGSWASKPAHAQDTVEPPPAITGSLRDTLRGVTRDSGNSGFGDLISDLTALEVATAPLGTPTAGIVFRFEDDQSFDRQQLNFVPLLLGRAATAGRSTAMFGFNVTTASYDTVSGLPLDSLSVASFQGRAPIVTSSTLDLSVDTLTVTGLGTFGVTDNLDVGVAVPVVAVTLGGAMLQQEAATGMAVFPVDASSVGLGDIGVTAQYRLWAGANIPDGLTARVTLRAPTGDANELRGVDTWRTLASATASRGFGRLSLHGTAGYESWSSSVALQNTLPANVVETWLLKDQVQVGGGLELAASSFLTVSFEGLWRRVGRTGQLESRSVAAPAPGVGIASAELLGVGPGGLEKTIMVPGISINIQENTMLTFQTIVSLSDTGMRDKIIPMIGLSWATCGDC